MKRALTLLTCVVLAGCATKPQTMPSYKMSEQPTKDRAYVVVKWMDDPSSICSSVMLNRNAYLGCAAQDIHTPRCTIYVRQPKDFNDTQALAVLGHELLHCLGASH